MKYCNARQTIQSERYGRIVNHSLEVTSCYDLISSCHFLGKRKYELCLVDGTIIYQRLSKTDQGFVVNRTWS